MAQVYDWQAQRNVVLGPPVTVNFGFTNFQGCWISAKKIGTKVGKQTSEVFHMLTDAGHLPF
jgi:hypothetical protein